MGILLIQIRMNGAVRYGIETIGTGWL
jgi:hypothetical protein